MPTIPCRDCAAPVSATARTCPRCGADKPYDQAERIPLGRALAILAGAFAVAVLIFLGLSR